MFPDLSWQYFGSAEGIHRQYPGICIIQLLLMLEELIFMRPFCLSNNALPIASCWLNDLLYLTPTLLGLFVLLFFASLVLTTN